MSIDFSFALRGLIIGLGVVLLFVVLPACSDDPILGPNDGTSDDGGSYSSINHLAPPASAVDSSTSTGRTARVNVAPNPERF